MPLKTKQLQHHEVINVKESAPFALICDGLTSPANAGGLLRLAEAFGLEAVHFCKSELKFDSPRLIRTARSSQNIVHYQAHEHTLPLIKSLKEKGYCTVGLELTNNSMAIEEFKNDGIEKIALVIGAEKNGISEEVLNVLNYTIHIPMSGINSSLNVGHATAIALYQLKQHLKYA